MVGFLFVCYGITFTASQVILISMLLAASNNFQVNNFQVNQASFFFFSISCIIYLQGLNYIALF